MADGRSRFDAGFFPEIPRLQQKLRQHVLAQSPGIGMAHMIDPALHAGIEFGKGDRPGPIGFVLLAEAAGGMAHLARLDPAVVREHHHAQPGYAAGRGHDLCRTFEL